MKIGIVIWNAFMFKHFYSIYKHLEHAEFLILSRGKNRADISSIRKHMDNTGIVYKDVDEAHFYKQDQNFDLYLSTFFPLSHKPIKKPFCIMQYGLAKDLNQFDYRWANADIRLLYGDFSSQKLDVSRNVFTVGNPRFDDFHNKKLDASKRKYIQEKLDPLKKTILYIPTWGDLSSIEIFEKLAPKISEKYNLIFLPHHLLDQKAPEMKNISKSSLLVGNEFGEHVDFLPYAFEVADCAISDSSGVIFDALYCDVPVVLFQRKGNTINKKKQSTNSLEFKLRTLIFDEDSDLSSILDGVEAELKSKNSLKDSEKYRLFARSGDCGKEAVRCMEIGFDDLVRNGSCPMVTSIRNLHAFRARSLAQKPTTKAKGILKKFKSRYFGLKFLPTRIMRVILRLCLAYHKPKLGAKLYTNVQFLRSLFYHNMLIVPVGRIALRSNDPSILEKLTRNLSGYKLSKKEKLHIFDYASNLGFDISALRSFCQGFELNGIEGRLGLLDQLSFKELKLLEDKTGINWTLKSDLVKYFSEGFRNTFGAHQPVDDTATSDVIGFFLPRNLLIESGSQSATFNKRLQVEFLENAISSLRELGYTIKFFIQGAWRLDASYLVHYPEGVSTYISWHTRSDRQRSNFPHCVNSICVKYGSIAGFFSVDEKGYAGFARVSDITPNTSKISTLNSVKIDDYRKWITENGVTKYKGVNSLPVNYDKRYLLFCLQVPDDTVSELSNFDTLEALDECIKFCEENDLYCIVRPHPKTHRYYQRKYNKYKNKKNVKFEHEVDLHHQIIASEFVITCNSGTGAEALLLGVPVVTFGKSDYRTMCKEAMDVGQLSELLHETLSIDKECFREETDKLMQSYLSEYHVPYDDQSLTRKRFQNLLGEKKS